MGSRTGGGNYRHPCLTMHQPWASLLVHGIKRVEGRSWPAPIRGRLWIHAASKIPDPDIIKAMEDFYREIYAVNGVTDIKFPENYPVSRLLGCVEVVGCLKCEELSSWEELPEGVRLEGQTEYCWLCEQPQRLVVPFEMRGFQGVYNLEKKIYEAAVRGLRPVEAPLPVKFPLPDPQDLFSLKPGSLSCSSSVSKLEQSVGLCNAIAGAQAAASQFAMKSREQSSAESGSAEENCLPVSSGTRSRTKASGQESRFIRR
ncbi:Activating signal cointegrator 1-like protein [Drosera capensis]